MDDSGVAPPAGRKRRVNKKNRDWRKRLHLRKTAVQPPTMQPRDKQGPKKIAGEWERSTAWPLSKKPPLEAQQSAAGTLRFKCSQCRDDLEYVAQDLVRHFEERHGGSPPVFSCQMCTFSTHDFSYLQVHLISHKDTFPSCSVCNDNVERTWSELSAHLTMYHCQNGKYLCETCPRFSTGDVIVFLEHIYTHSLVLDAGSVDPSMHKVVSKSTIDPTQKLLKHIKAVRVCPSGDQKKKRMVRSTAMKPNELVPKTKARVTRSAVREMCWLTQDCLSLPGRDFLEKYCHLPDAQTTLEETRQFLSGDQKWTRALETVLSHVPKASENGAVLGAPDLTVLTVKNKITVAQNGSAYTKKLKVMTRSDREAVTPESSELNRCQSEDCPQTETKQNNDVSMPAQDEGCEGGQMQENQQNQEFKPKLDVTKNQEEEPMHEGGITCKLKKVTEGVESVQKAASKTKRQSRRRKRKRRTKRRDKRSMGVALKLVLKKSPEKGQQWVSQSSLPPSGGGDEVMEASQIPQTSDMQVVEPQQIMQAIEKQNWTKATTTDTHELPEAIAADPEEEQSPGCSGNIEKPEAKTPTGLENSASAQEPCPGNIQSSSTSEGTAAPHSSFTKSSPIGQPPITPQGEGNSEDLSLALCSEHMADGEPADSGPGLHDDSGPAPPPLPPLPPLPSAAAPPSPASGGRWKPVPKHQERTLKLVALSPMQLVKCPSRRQPVVVLNHPDVDIPEVARIMEVVHRYRGEVQKVALSSRTSRALSEAPHPCSSASGQSCVQERFLLRLKLRRLSRKKYEVVGGASAQQNNMAASAPRFRCWFCGRVFACRDAWMSHQQRHLMECGTRPSCENP